MGALIAVQRRGLGRLGAGVALGVRRAAVAVGVQRLQGARQRPLVVLGQAVVVRGQQRARAAVHHVHALGTPHLERELVLEAQRAAPAATGAQAVLVLLVQVALDQLGAGGGTRKQEVQLDREQAGSEGRNKKQRVQLDREQAGSEGGNRKQKVELDREKGNTFREGNMSPAWVVSD